MTAVPKCKSHEFRRLPGRFVISMGERVQAEVQVCVWIIKLLSLQVRAHEFIFCAIEKSHKYLAFCRCDETESATSSRWICLDSSL